MSHLSNEAVSGKASGITTKRVSNGAWTNGSIKTIEGSGVGPKMLQLFSKQSETAVNLSAGLDSDDDWQYDDKRDKANLPITHAVRETANTLHFKSEGVSVLPEATLNFAGLGVIGDGDLNPSTTLFNAGAPQTSDTSPYIVSGTLNYGPYLPYKAFDTISGNVFMSANGFVVSPSNPMYAIIDFGIEKKVFNKAKIVAGNEHSSPADYTIEAWDGSNWVVQKTVTGRTDGNGVVYYIAWNNSIGYSKYKISITAGYQWGAAGNVTLGECGFIEAAIASTVQVDSIQAGGTNLLSSVLDFITGTYSKPVLLGNAGANAVTLAGNKTRGVIASSVPDLTTRYITSVKIAVPVSSDATFRIIRVISNVAYIVGTLATTTTTDKQVIEIPIAVPFIASPTDYIMFTGPVSTYTNGNHYYIIPEVVSDATGVTVTAVGSNGLGAAMEFTVDFPLNESQATALPAIVSAINNGPTSVVADQHPDYPTRIRLTDPTGSLSNAVVSVATQGVSLTKLSDFNAYEDGSCVVNGPAIVEASNGAYNSSTTVSTAAQSSDSTPLTVSASSTFGAGYEPYRAFNKAATSWISASAPTIGSPQFIEIQGLNLAVNKYRIKNRDGAQGSTPSEWKLLGWTGSEYIELHSVTGYTVGTSDTYTPYYTFLNSTVYLNYKIEITARQGADGFVSIGEVDLVESQVYTGPPATLGDNLGIFPGAQIVDTLDNKYHITDISTDNKVITVGETLPPDAEWEVKRIANAETYSLTRKQETLCKLSDWITSGAGVLNISADGTIQTTSGSVTIQSVKSFDGVADGEIYRFYYSSSNINRDIGIQNSASGIDDAFVGTQHSLYSAGSGWWSFVIEGGNVVLYVDYGGANTVKRTWSAVPFPIKIKCTGISTSAQSKNQFSRFISPVQDGGFRVTSGIDNVASTNFDFTSYLATVTGAGLQAGTLAGAWNNTVGTQTQWNPATGFSNTYTQIDLGASVIKPGQVSLKSSIYASRWFTSWVLQGSNNATNWETFCSGGNESAANTANTIIGPFTCTSGTKSFRYLRFGAISSSTADLQKIYIKETVGKVDTNHFHVLAPNGQDSILYKPSAGAQVTNFGFRLPDNSGWAVNLHGEEGYMAFATKFNLDLTPKNCVIYNKTTEEPEVIATAIASERGGLGSDGTWYYKTVDGAPLIADSLAEFLNFTGDTTANVMPIQVQAQPASYGPALFGGSGFNQSGPFTTLSDGSDVTGTSALIATNGTAYWGYDFGAGNEKAIRQVRVVGLNSASSWKARYSDDGITYTDVPDAMVRVGSVQEAYDDLFPISNVGAHRFWILYPLGYGGGGRTIYTIDWFEAATFLAPSESTVEVAFPIVNQPHSVDFSSIVILDENDVAYDNGSGGIFEIEVSIDGGAYGAKQDLGTFISDTDVEITNQLKLRITILGNSLENQISKITLATYGNLWTPTSSAARAFASALQVGTTNRNPASYFQYTHPDLLTQTQWGKYFYGTDKVAPFVGVRSLAGGAPEFTNIWAEFSAALRDIKLGTGSVSVEPIVGSKQILLTNVSGSTIDNIVDAYILG